VIGRPPQPTGVLRQIAPEVIYRLQATVDLINAIQDIPPQP
jgi:hypothetical protein